MTILLGKKSGYYCVLSVIALLLCCSSLSVSAGQTVSLSFGLYASDKPTSLVKKFRPILNKLEQELSRELQQDVKIKLSIAKTYQAGIDNLVQGKVDFVRFGPASYVIAKRKNPAITLLAMETKKGKKHFNGVIATHDTSSIRSVRDLRQKRFAFGSKHSTIGRYLSQQYLLQHGIRAKDLTAFDYLGRHDKVGYAIALKKFDAGALKESTFKKLVKKGQPLRAIASFRNVTKPWVVRSGIERKTVDALQKALLQLKDKKILAGIKKDGFVRASHSDYEGVNKAIMDNKKFYKK